MHPSIQSIQAAGATASGTGRESAISVTAGKPAVQAGFCLCICTGSDEIPATRQAGLCLTGMCTGSDGAPVRETDLKSVLGGMSPCPVLLSSTWVRSELRWLLPVQVWPTWSWCYWTRDPCDRWIFR